MGEDESAPEPPRAKRVVDDGVPIRTRRANPHRKNLSYTVVVLTVLFLLVLPCTGAIFGYAVCSKAMKEM